MKSALRQALLYLLVAAVVITATVLVALCIPHLPDPLSFATLCLVVLAGSALSAPHGTLTVTLAGLVIVSVYLIAGPATAIVIAFVGSVLLIRRPVPLIKRIFSIAVRVLSAAGGALAFVLLDGPVGSAIFDEIPRALVAVTAAAVAHQVVNAATMCTYMWLERGLEPVRFFLQSVVRPTALPMLGYSYLSFLLAVMWLGGLGFVAALPVLVPLIVARWALAQDEAETKAQAATMGAFIQVIEAKDFYTRGHSERVSQGVGLLGRQLGLPADRLHALENAGLLHDCGKVGVPTSTLRKAGRLDDSEWDAIRLHPARGVELIGDIPFLEEVKSAVLHHHEKYDGSGYPAGLSGKKIPYFARMIGIVDAFDCITSTRPYRPARGVEETLEILVHDKYTHFDPDLVDAFVTVVRKHGWVAAPAEQPVPDPSVPAMIDHDDLSLGSGGGATGSAAGPT